MRMANVWNLGIKELRSLLRDPIMLILIVYSFTFSIYSIARAIPETLNKAPIAIVDEDASPLSARLISAFYPPQFLPPVLISQPQMDTGMDAGLYTFALDIPPDFQRDVLAGRQPTIQLNVDATRMSQAFNGSAYIQTIINDELQDFLRRHGKPPAMPADLALRVLFNPNLTKSWFSTVVQVINNITMLSIILTGAALIRELEHGTIEHLLVMPVTPLEIMLSKIWSMALVVLLACAFSLVAVVQGLLDIPLAGSLTLFLVGAALNLFATTSMGIYMATLTRSMPQFGLLLMLVLMPLQILSGGVTPRESMPLAVQYVMTAAPNTHFITLSQAVLFRGAGLAVVWPQLVALAVIGTALFLYALRSFRNFLR
jgi:ABC-2 type transport system permease protein